MNTHKVKPSHNSCNHLLKIIQSLSFLILGLQTLWTYDDSTSWLSTWILHIALDVLRAYFIISFKDYNIVIKHGTPTFHVVIISYHCKPHISIIYIIISYFLGTCKYQFHMMWPHHGVGKFLSTWFAIHLLVLWI